MKSDVAKWVGSTTSKWLSLLIFIVLIQVLIIGVLIKQVGDNKIVVERSPYSTYPEIKIMRFSGDRAFREVWALHMAKTLGNIIPKEGKLVVESLKYMAPSDVYTSMLSDIDLRFSRMASESVRVTFNPAGKILHDVHAELVTIQGYQKIESLLTEEFVEKPYAYVFGVEAYNYGPYITSYSHGYIEAVSQ